MLEEVRELLSQGKWFEAKQKALEFYNQTKDDRYLNLYAIALVKLFEFEEAEKIFKELYSKYPDSEELAFNYAWTLMELRKFEDAEKFLRETLMLFPESQKLTTLLEICEKKKKEKESVSGKGEVSAEVPQKSEEETEAKEEGKGEEEIQVQQELSQEEIEKLIEMQKQGEENKEGRVEAKETETQIKEKKEEEQVGKVEKEEERIFTFGKTKYVILPRRVEIKIESPEDFVIARERYIIFIEGKLSVEFLYRRGTKKKEIFGDEDNKFVKIRGTSQVILSDTGFELLLLEGNLAVVEDFLVAFASSYSNQIFNIDRKRRLNVVDVSGGPVILWKGENEIVKYPINGEGRVELAHLVAFSPGLAVSIKDTVVKFLGNGEVLLIV